MRWCRQCILPDTRPNLVLGPDGICNACATHDVTSAVDWEARQEMFHQVVDNAKASASTFDCVVPVSGGKDSTWQVVTCLEHGLHPLAVTWKTPARTEIGARNLANLIELGVDHIDYQVSPSVERRFMLRALAERGDPAIPMHMALFSIPLTIAVRFRIPLIVWGENSAVEYGGDEASMGHLLDESWLSRYGVTHGTVADDWVTEELTAEDLASYSRPSADELEQAGVLAVFLGHYFQWDPGTALAVARAHGFESDPAGPRTGYYDFADIDDHFISVHHYLKWYKFGFTRLFDNLSLEIRNKRMTRDEALDIVRARGDELPSADIDKLCDFLGITRARFFEMAERFRNPAIWEQQGGRWVIPDFVVSDWSWS